MRDTDGLVIRKVEGIGGVGGRTFSPLPPGVPAPPRSPGMPPLPWCPALPAAPTEPGSPWKHTHTHKGYGPLVIQGRVCWLIHESLSAFFVFEPGPLTSIRYLQLDMSNIGNIFMPSPCHHRYRGDQRVHGLRWIPEVQRFRRLRGYRALPIGHKADHMIVKSNRRLVVDQKGPRDIY